jgi:hypothetical protein
MLHVRKPKAADADPTPPLAAPASLGGPGGAALQKPTPKAEAHVKMEGSPGRRLSPKGEARVRVEESMGWRTSAGGRRISREAAPAAAIAIIRVSAARSACNSHAVQLSWGVGTSHYCPI